MSIIISNISDEYSRDGMQTYEIRLNNILLTTFQHYSPDGMAECLGKASVALTGVDIDEKIAEHKKEEFYKLLRSISYE